VAKGIKSFKKGMAEDDQPAREIEHKHLEPIQPTAAAVEPVVDPARKNGNVG
jgi:Sec-independent protein translocase protein TatA